MKAQKFKLWMGYLGNGITVCNSMVKESGDYKTIAHISNTGRIQYYVSNGYIPACDVKRIEEAAERQRQEFLSYWNSLNDIQKYEKLLDVCKHSDFMEVVQDKTTTLSEIVKRLENKYI